MLAGLSMDVLPADNNLRNLRVTVDIGELANGWTRLLTHTGPNIFDALDDIAKRPSPSCVPLRRRGIISRGE